MIFADGPSLVSFARRRCRYYAERYRELPDSPRWDEVPVLDPTHYWAAKARDFDATLTSTPATGWLWTTGGSSSQTKRVAVSSEDFAEEIRVFTPALVSAGLSPGDRVANLTWAGELSASFVLTGAILDRLPVLQLPILGNSDPERILALCRELRPTALLSFPFVLVRLARMLLARGETLTVDKLLYAGARLHDDQREALLAAFAPRSITPFGYAAVDCGPIAAVDLELGDDIYRPLSGYSLVELVDEDDRPINEIDQPGRVVITNLGRCLSPVIRFPIGDVGRWVIPRRAFRLDGRFDRSVKLGFWIVAHADVVAETEAVPGLSSMVQLWTSRRAGVEWLEIRVVADAGLDGEVVEHARALLRARLRARYPALGEPPGGPANPVLTVTPCSPEQLAWTHAGKLRDIVDLTREST